MQALAFKLNKQIYAYPVLQVVEIVASERFTVHHVPGAERCVKGIACIRGRNVTVLDTHAIFGVDPIAEKHLLVIETMGGEFALATDGVVSIMNYDENQVQMVMGRPVIVDGDQTTLLIGSGDALEATLKRLAVD